jgi:predicted esterase
MPPRIPTEADFEPLKSTLPHALQFPSPREATTSILILFHGLGDHETPFASFARNLSLPGVLAISIRGTSPLPAYMLEGLETSPIPHSHWGDDLLLDEATGDIDPDPGFERAGRLVMDKLVRQTLLEKCGWEMSDIMLFGFGQGGSVALGLAAQLGAGHKGVDISEGEEENDGGKAFKGVVSLGGLLPKSMVPSGGAKQGKRKTSVMVVQLDKEEVEAVEEEFADVKVVNWKRKQMSMPQEREEVLPLMHFFADRLNSEI